MKATVIDQPLAPTLPALDWLNILNDLFRFAAHLESRDPEQAGVVRARTFRLKKALGPAAQALRTAEWHARVDALNAKLANKEK